MMLELEVLTPDTRVLSQSVRSVVLPTSQGEVGILPGHIPLLAVLEPGELLIVSADGEALSLAISAGFAQVRGDRVSVITEAAIHVEAIDLEAIVQAQARAEAAMLQAKSRPAIDFAEVESLENFIRYATAQQHLKNKRKRP
jgi:F-type H+-transporting ATPase subunit epsilon